MPISGPIENKIAFLFHLLNAYRPTDSGTFYGLKIGPLLAEIKVVFFLFFFYPYRPTGNFL